MIWVTLPPWTMTSGSCAQVATSHPLVPTGCIYIFGVTSYSLIQYPQNAPDPLSAQVWDWTRPILSKRDLVQFAFG